MIPKIYDSQKSFLGYLPECVSCKVTEERNGIYEVEFEEVVTSAEYSLIQIDGYIKIPHDGSGEEEYFRIYARSVDINGNAKFSACHESYDLSNMIIMPFTDSTVNQALFASKVVGGYDFTYMAWHYVTMRLETPMVLRDFLLGSDQSVLEASASETASGNFGEFKFTGRNISLLATRGQDRGVVLAYGVNISSCDWSLDAGDCCNAYLPYYQDGDTYVDTDGTPVIGSSIPVELIDSNLDDSDDDPIQFGYFKLRPQLIDYSELISWVPTRSKLKALAQSRIDAKKPWLAKSSVGTCIVDFNNSDGCYSDKIYLCDKVTVRHEAIGLEEKVKVSSLTWDVLSDKISSITFGSSQRETGVR